MHVCSYGRGPNPQPFRQKFGQPAACRRPNSESALAHASANSIGPREIFWLQDPKAVGGGRPSAVLMLASSPTRKSHCAGPSTQPEEIDLGPSAVRFGDNVAVRSGSGYGASSASTECSVASQGCRRDPQRGGGRGGAESGEPQPFAPPHSSWRGSTEALEALEAMT